MREDVEPDMGERREALIDRAVEVPPHWREYIDPTHFPRLIDASPATDRAAVAAWIDHRIAGGRIEETEHTLDRVGLLRAAIRAEVGV